jgi:hypothetical protein
MNRERYEKTGSWPVLKISSLNFPENIDDKHENLSHESELRRDKILGSLGGEYEDDCLPGYCADDDGGSKHL